ncbi:hypothetical protein OROHE_012762 [Orobanche hederae]
MKDRQKRWQPNSTDSVIARLMGFEELCPPQKPPCEKHRVLSESYVRNAASVGVRPGSLVALATGRLRSTKNEIVHEVRDVSRLQISEGENYNFFEKCVDSSTSKMKKGIRKPKHVLRYLQKYEQDSLTVTPHLGELGIDYMKRLLEFQSDAKDKPPGIFSTSISAEKTNSDLEDVKLDRHSRPGYKEHRMSFKPESGKDTHQLAYKEPVVSDVLSCRHSYIAYTRNMSIISPQERRTNKFDELSRTGCTGDKYVVDDFSPGLDDLQNQSHDPDCVVQQSYLPSESKKQNNGRWQTAKDVQEVGVSVRGQNLDKILASADKKTMSRSGLYSPSSLQSRNLGSISPSVYSSVDFWEDGYRKSLPLFKFEAIKEVLSSGKKDESTTRSSYLKEQNISQKGILEPKGGRRFEQFPGENDTMSLNPKISKSFSCYFSSSDEAYVRGVHDEIDNSFENDRCKETKFCPKASFSNIAAHCINDATYARGGEGLSIGLCTRTNGDHQLESVPFILSAESEHSSYVQEVSFKEALLNEYSEEESAYSNSSRMSFRIRAQHEENLSAESRLSSRTICLQLQLQPLNFDSEETYSEGSIMLVSGNEDFDERSGDLSHDGRSVKTWLGDDNSRNYSYMVDVLDEAGCCGMKSFINFKTWYSLECPISPSVFEALEKKYGKQTSWQKSERRLLFDRINSGLISIFNPVIYFHACPTSIRSRFCASLRRDEAEDELWMILSSHEKEKSDDLSEKVFEKWFEIEEGINIICGELETTLFDDLMMELASSWD